MLIHLVFTAVSFRKSEVADEHLRAAFVRLANHDVAALEDIYDLCANDVYALAFWRTASTHDASDVVQEVFLRLAKIRDSLITIRKPRNYILQITHRLCLDHYRRRQRAQQQEEQIDNRTIRFTTGNNILSEERVQLHHAISKLNPKQREALYLHYFAGLSFSEISEVCDVSLFTAASRCRLAVQHLRKLWKKKHDG